MAASVSRLMRFAWLEYEDFRDGVYFDRAFTAAGWRNLFLDLAPVTPAPGRADLGNPNLKIRWFAGKNPNELALIATPSAADTKFLEKWIVNPGVGGIAGGSDGSEIVTNFRLTHGFDTSDQADMLVISGHGAAGVVAGAASGQPSTIQLFRAFDRRNAPSASGRLKYLVVPTCSNLKLQNAPQWLLALDKDFPLHGVLGYSGGYNGDIDGATVMIRFANILHGQPDKTILQAWREANVGRPWGAVAHALSAEQDTLRKWRANKLPEPPRTRFLHFEPSHAEGVEIPTTPPPWTAMFHMTPGPGGSDVEITSDNHNQPDIGLLPGARGYLLLRHDGASFPNDVMRVVFGMFRFDHPDTNLTTLLQFDAGPSIKLITNGNVEIPRSGRVDALDVSLPPGAQELKLHYTVLATAVASYPPDPNMGMSPMFIVALFPPGTDRSHPFTEGSMLGHGAFLR